MATGIDNMQPRSVAVFAVTLAIFAVATLFILLRMISRAAIVKRLTPDDYLIVVAWVITFGLTFSICYGATVGLGRHEVDVPAKWQVPLDKSQYAFSVLYNPALMAEKTSILVFYLSLSKTNKIFRWATIGTLFVVNAAGLALTIVTICQCRPISAAFTVPTPSNAQCTDIVTIYLSSAPVNILTDLAILFLPMPILTGMRLPRKQKIILVVTFGFGIFVAAVDVVRIAYLQSASSYRLHELQTDGSTSGRDTDETDFSWYASFSFMWSAIEVSVGCMCACVPALKPLVSRFMPHLLRDSGEATFGEKSQSSAERMAQDQRVPSLPDDDFVVRDFCPPSPKPAEDRSMGMMDFLTTPDMNELPTKLQRTTTAITNTSRDTGNGEPTFFDFVNMKGNKCMVQMSNRESLFPLAMVTILFFIWGFEYGLLAVLNAEFQAVARMSSGQTVALHSAYYAGYLLGPPTVGRLVLKHWGFKACYTIGLAIYACGSMIFWPAAVLTSFTAYVIVNIIVGFGLSILEVAANPFIVLCGPRQYAEIRLNLSQGFQAIGTVVAPLIAAKAFTKYTADAPSLIKTQWAYLGISLLTVALAVAYYYLPLPEATCEELEDAAERMDGANKAKAGKVPIIWVVLGFGVLSQFCYVGGQETMSASFDGYLGLVAPTLDTSNYMAIAHTLFAVSRFLAAGAGFFIAPRLLLLFFYAGAVIFGGLAMNFSGDTATAILLMVFFFEGPLFSLIFAQSLRGMGKNTKLASVFITTAISGGAVFPAIAYAVSQSRGAQYALCVAVAAFACGTLMPIWLNFHPLARKLVDPKDDKPSTDNRAPSSTSSRGSRALTFLTLRMKGGKEGGKEGSTEWRERHSDRHSPT